MKLNKMRVNEICTYEDDIKHIENPLIHGTQYDMDVIRLHVHYFT